MVLSESRSIERSGPGAAERSSAPHFAAKARQSAYRRLSDELGLLLGPAGAQLVRACWRHHHLTPTEQGPDKLRPATLSIFGAAARLAAPRGSRRALQALRRAFEADYLGRNVEARSPASPGFAMLALIRSGQDTAEAPLLVGGPYRAAPSRAPSEAERSRLRREFLYRSACGSRNWSESYRRGTGYQM